MTDFLEKIRLLKEEEVAVARNATPLEELKARVRDLPPPRDFKKALAGEGVSLIAEVKRSSPSAGTITAELDPGRVAFLYEKAGAAAVSVLTESRYFGGMLEDLKAARKAIGLPVLRKDFIIDEYQIYESRAAGADAVLLISEMLGEEKIARLLEVIRELRMEALVEAHGDKTLADAIGAGAGIIGINNRNLKTLRVDLKTSLRLLCWIPDDRIRVAESGIKNQREAALMREGGADAVLVGSALIESEDPVSKIKELLSFQ